MVICSIAHLRKSAFTLIELLIAIAIMGILASLVIVAINPQKQLSDAKDAKRRSDLKVILDGVYQYQIDVSQLPKYVNGSNTIVLDTARFICSHPDSNTCNFFGYSYLKVLSGTYIANLPADPDNTEQFHTNYQIWIDTDGRIHVNAPLGDEGVGIELSR